MYFLGGSKSSHVDSGDSELSHPLREKCLALVERLNTLIERMTSQLAVDQKSTDYFKLSLNKMAKETTSNF